MKSRKLAGLTAFAILVALVGLITFSVREASAAATLTVGNPSSLPCIGNYPTISAAVAVASAGDTIKVCQGTYDELVNVNKQLTLLGAQSGVDARSGSRTGLPATESVVNGLLGSTSFYVTTNDVIIDGFTVQGNTQDNLFGAGIVLGGGTAGAHVLNNIVQNNIAGLFLANNSATDQAVIQHNLFRNNTNPGAAGGTGIYSDQFVGGGAVNNVLIDSNDFVITNNSPDTWGIGISNTDAAHPFTNLNIQNNKFASASPSSRGMYFFSTHSSSIKGNLISNKTNYAIGFFGDDVGITIQCDTIQNDGKGVWVADSFGGPNSNISLTDNNIAGNTTAGLEVDTGLYLGGPGSLNAQKNWWGSATGPTILSNPGGSGDIIIDPDGVVNYRPFLTSAQGLPCPTPPTREQCEKAFEQKEKAFADKQKAEKKLFDSQPHTKAQKKAFEEQQEADAKAFRKQNEIDEKQCDSLSRGGKDDNDDNDKDKKRDN
jgi:hypothetical protein